MIFDLSDSPYNAAIKDDAMVILTEWRKFDNNDWRKICEVMRKPSWLFDTRDIANHSLAQLYGLKLWQLGKFI